MVNKSQRDDKSEVCYLASQLELKILHMVMNEKYFPKRARFIISNRIVDLSMAVSENFDTANGIFPTSEGKLEIRENYQAVGKGKLVALSRQLNVAYRLFNIPGGVLEDVFDLITQINKKYSNWVKSARKVLKRNNQNTEETQSNLGENN